MLNEKQETNNSQKEESDRENALVTLVTETSAHGIKNVFSSKRAVIIRCLWFIAVAGAAVCLGLTLYTVADNYYKYPFVTTSHTMPQTEMTFPTVTICNLNYFDVSQYEYPEEMKNILLHYSINQFYPVLNESQHPYNIIFNTSQKELTDRLSPPFLAMCQWQNEFMDCEDIFKPVYNYIGLCYVFNVNGSSEWSTDKVGSSSGLRVIFFISQEHGVVTSDFSAGLKVQLHEPYEKPDLSNQGFVVAPGHSTNVEITRNEFRFLPYPYRAFGDEACADTTSPNFQVRVNYSTTYSQSACQDECVSDLATIECQCKSTVHGDEMPYPYCTFYQMVNCYYPKLGQYTTEARTNNTCYCPRPCSFIRYRTRMSTSAFPSVATGNALVTAGAAANVVQTRNNYGEIRLYYEDLMLYETKHEPQYTLNSIMATVGGQMGFFLGASLLTLAELGEFLIISLGRLFRFTLLRFSASGQLRSNNKVVQVRPLH